MNRFIAQSFVAIQNNANLPAWNVLLSPAGWISKILPYIFSIAGIGLLIFIVISGLQMMTSRGDPKAMQAAQSRITTSLIGFVIIFLAYTLVKLIGIVFGVTVFGTIFK